VRTSPSRAPGTNITTTVLDIDIQKNEPKIISTKSESNPTNWHGLEIGLTILGNFSNCRSKVLQYFQQLAVITPYANFALDFKCIRDPKKSFNVKFTRRSEQMPVPPAETLPHPRGLNNITLQTLLRSTKAGNMVQFLTKELCGISPAIANRIAGELNLKDTSPHAVSSMSIAALLQTLRDEKGIKDPSPHVLSPAGEYNIRLGVLKELQPRLVATFTDKAGSHDGHAFTVEAAVSLGGPSTREGLNVYRFANRIPLLFETGADVVTQVSSRRINWSSYHMDAKKDNIGIFISIVSTKLPFKGTSKEYIGDDVLEMNASVKRAIQGCCQQLRVALAISMAHKEQQERRKTLIRYLL
jgi:DNA topoisomerase-6 subunit B